MSRFSKQQIVFMTSLVIASCLLGINVQADEGGLKIFVGKWNVHVKVLQPEKSEVTYTETYEWALDRKFLRGKTGRKSDGSQDIIFATYDEQAKGYPFWIFSSKGTYVYLAPATWDASTRTMEWENPPQFDISYQSRCTFPDENSRQCTLIMKDWKGSVLQELKWSASRLSD